MGRELLLAVETAVGHRLEKGRRSGDLGFVCKVRAIARLRKGTS